ncbi:MAG: hypothetical protein ACLP7P_15940 [Rhodomicrobium sp.]
MHRHSEGLNQVLKGWWRKKAVNSCPDEKAMWHYWHYTKTIERDAGSSEVMQLSDAEKLKNETRDAA